MIIKQQVKDHAWGRETIWAKTEKYAAKFLHIKEKMKLDRQFHNHKAETVYVLYGTLVIEIGNEEVEIKKGQSFHINPGVVHRYCSTFGEVDVIVVSNSELEDVVRVENDFFKFK
jgi:mannose-6-phosphate isomerase-like protein (cupin superfamily)